MTTRQTRQQELAASAWHTIEEVENRSASLHKKYGSLVRGLPAMIQTDGLAQTLAFLRAKDGNKGDSEHGLAYAHVEEWVLSRFGHTGHKDLMELLLDMDSSEYRWATHEALSYLHWLKRFVEAKGWKSDEE